jgi:hypothetical protein
VIQLGNRHSWKSHLLTHSISNRPLQRAEFICVCTASGSVAYLVLPMALTILVAESATSLTRSGHDSWVESVPIREIRACPQKLPSVGGSSNAAFATFALLRGHLPMSLGREIPTGFRPPAQGRDAPLPWVAVQDSSQPQPGSRRLASGVMDQFSRSKTPRF